MLDIKLVREKSDYVRERLSTRGAGDENKISELLQLDEQRRKLVSETETLKSQRNRVSKEIGALMGQKKLEEAEAKKAETRTLGDQIAAIDKQVAEVEQKRDELQLTIPNIPHESVVVGKTAADNPIVRVHGEKPEFAFQPKTHIELAEAIATRDGSSAATRSRNHLSAMKEALS